MSRLGLGVLDVVQGQVELVVVSFRLAAILRAAIRQHADLLALGKEVHPVVAPIYQIEELIKKNYGADAASLDSILAELGGGITFGGEGGNMDIMRANLTASMLGPTASKFAFSGADVASRSRPASWGALSFNHCRTRWPKDAAK